MALCAFIGGVGGGRLVVGPAEGDKLPIEPMHLDVFGIHEAAALGTIFPNQSNQPTLHMHAVLGRDKETKAGCIRPGLDIWTIGEVVILEFSAPNVARAIDPATGFELLSIDTQ